MQLLITLLAFFQLSYALHIRAAARNIPSRVTERSTQDASIDLTQSDTTNAANAKKPKKPIPWWRLPNTNNGEMNALTGQQFYPFDDEDDDYESNDDASNPSGDQVCPLTQCPTSGELNKDYCGPHARCLGGYCQCNLGWKPESGVATARGWTGLEALTVWADNTYTGCTARCNSLSCSEVLQVKGCFDGSVKNNDNDVTNNMDQESLATDGLHLGAIKAPGADAGIDGQAI